MNLSEGAEAAACGEYNMSEPQVRDVRHEIQGRSGVGYD